MTTALPWIGLTFIAAVSCLPALRSLSRATIKLLGYDRPKNLPSDGGTLYRFNGSDWRAVGRGILAAAAAFHGSALVLGGSVWCLTKGSTPLAFLSIGIGAIVSAAGYGSMRRYPLEGAIHTSWSWQPPPTPLASMDELRARILDTGGESKSLMFFADEDGPLASVVESEARLQIMLSHPDHPRDLEAWTRRLCEKWHAESDRETWSVGDGDCMLCCFVPDRDSAAGLIVEYFASLCQIPESQPLQCQDVA